MAQISMHDLGQRSNGSLGEVNESILHRVDQYTSHRHSTDGYRGRSHHSTIRHVSHSSTKSTNPNTSPITHKYTPRVYPIWMPFTFAGTILLFCNVSLRIWHIPIGLKFASWFMLGFNSCMTPMIFPFIHLLMKDDNEAKSFTTGAMVCYSIVFQ